MNAFYVCQQVVANFNEKFAAAMKIAENMLQQEKLAQDSMFIKTYFSLLPTTMKTLKATDLPLNNSVEIYFNCINHLSSIPGDCG